MQADERVGYCIWCDMTTDGVAFCLNEDRSYDSEGCYYREGIRKRHELGPTKHNELGPTKHSYWWLQGGVA
jgi:hypothetical protein